MNYIETFKIILGVILILLGMFMWDDSTAATPYIQLNGISYHTYRAGQNEINPGLGVRWKQANGVSFSAGRYKNSLNGQSVYWSVGYSRYSNKIEYGAEISVVSGYAYTVIPTFIIGGDILKFRVIPKPNPVMAVSLEFKI